MRINPQELHTLRAIVGELDPAGQLYLYGSRVDDTRRGGDIDLYLKAIRPIDLKTRDALILRYSSCVSMMQDQLFRAIAHAEQEDISDKSNRDKAMAAFKI